MCACAALLLSCAPASTPSSASSSSGADGHESTAVALQLVRCLPQREAACLMARMALVSASSPARAVRLSDRLEWTGRLAGTPLLGPRFASTEARPFATGVGGVTATGRELPAPLRPVFAAPSRPAASLARTALDGVLTLRRRSLDSLVVAATWRPPLLTLPAFTGVADAGALPAAVRDALADGAEPPSLRRPLLALLLVLGVLLIVGVPRLAWSSAAENDEELAQQLAAARALMSWAELEALRGAPPRDAAPRTPDEPTREWMPGREPNA